MKKIVLSVAVFAISLSTAFSQEFKPKEKEFALGVGLTDFKSFSLVNGISGRYFHKSDLAFRASFYIDRVSNAKYEYVVGTNEENGYNINNIMNLTFGLGLEKHFDGTDRLDPYIGADILLGMFSDDREIKNVIGEITTVEKTNSNFGVRLLAGADFYIFPKVYLGTEFGITYNSNTMGETIETVGDNPSTVTKYDDFFPESTIDTRIGAQGAIRVGFRF